MDHHVRIHMSLIFVFLYFCIFVFCIFGVDPVHGLFLRVRVVVVGSEGEFRGQSVEAAAQRSQRRTQRPRHVFSSSAQLPHVATSTNNYVSTIPLIFAKYHPPWYRLIDLMRTIGFCSVLCCVLLGDGRGCSRIWVRSAVDALHGELCRADHAKHRADVDMPLFLPQRYVRTVHRVLALAFQKSTIHTSAI